MTKETTTKPENSSKIKVILRIRPRFKAEGEDCVEVQNDGRSIVIDQGTEASKRAFIYDAILDSRVEGKAGSAQEDVYEEVGKDLVLAALGDYNACIFAYGHTGSGKTFTMLGNPSAGKKGLIPRCIVELFAEQAAASSDSGNHPVSSPNNAAKSTYSCDFYEVYNETIRDLLAPGHIRGKDRQRTVHAHPKHGVHIDGLSQSVVNTPEECLELIAFGNQMRAMAMTTMNEQSSRSHAIFTFRIQENGHGSTFTFVDLAGREDQTASDNKAMQLREMCYINTSLFHLAHLITKLSEGALQKGSLAAFRNSKLTLLLSQALIGNCKTALIATMAPAVDYYDDTLSTLQFAQQVKKVETQPQVNKKATPAMLRDLQDELNRLKSQLSQAAQSNTETEQELFAAQAMIRHLQASPQDVLEASKAARNQRMTIMGELGLHVENSALPTDATGEIVPFFTKLSDDTSLQGCCNYFITKNALRFGSSALACDVVLQGVGVTPLMCLVESIGHDRSKVLVSLLGCGEDEEEEEMSEDNSGFSDSSAESEVFIGSTNQVPRVLINGQPLTPDGHASHTMEHGDCLVLGYAHAFRLVIPGSVNDKSIAEEDEENDETESTVSGRRSEKRRNSNAASSRNRASCIAQDTLPDLSLQGALSMVGAETSDQFKHVMPALLQYGMRPENEAIVNNLKLKLTKVCPLVDEANTITDEIFGAMVLRLRAHVLNDRPGPGRDRLQLVVCVYECFNAHANVRRDDELHSPGPRSPRGGMSPGSRSPMSGRRFRGSVGRSGGGGRPSLGKLVSPSGRNFDKLLPRQSKSNSIFGSLGLSELDPDNPGNEEVDEDQLLYVWPVDKFLRRLREMREVYQAGCAMGDKFHAVRSQLRENRHLNPWHEAAVTEVKMIMEGEGPTQKVGIATRVKDDPPRRESESPIEREGRTKLRTDGVLLIDGDIKEKPVPKLQLPVRSRSHSPVASQNDGSRSGIANQNELAFESKELSAMQPVLEEKESDQSASQVETKAGTPLTTEVKAPRAKEIKTRRDLPNFGLLSEDKDSEDIPEEQEEQLASKMSFSQALQHMTAESSQKSRGLSDRFQSMRPGDASQAGESLRKDTEPRRSFGGLPKEDEAVVYDPSLAGITPPREPPPSSLRLQVSNEQFDVLAAQLKTLASHAESFAEASEVLALLKPLQSRLQKLEQKCENIPEEVVSALGNSGVGNSSASAAFSPRSVEAPPSKLAGSTPETSRVLEESQVLETPRVQHPRDRVTTISRGTTQHAPRVVRRFVSAPEHVPPPFGSGIEEEIFDLPPWLTRNSPPLLRGQGSHSQSQTPICGFGDDRYPPWSGSASLPHPRYSLVRSLSPPQPPAPNFVVAPPSRMKALSPSRSLGVTTPGSPAPAPPMIMLSPRHSPRASPPGTPATSIPAGMSSSWTAANNRQRGERTSSSLSMRSQPRLSGRAAWH